MPADTFDQFYSEKYLARRWGRSHRTLERWRSEGRGPAFHKIEGRILYRHSDVDAFEASHRRNVITTPAIPRVIERIIEREAA